MTNGTNNTENILEMITAQRALSGYKDFTAMHTEKPISSRTLRRAIQEKGRTARQRLAILLAHKYHELVLSRIKQAGQVGIKLETFQQVADAN